MKVDRLDVYLNKKYGFSRNYAKEVINKGFITVNEKVVLKASFKISEDDIIKVDEMAKLKYVSRGGLKLEKALEVFEICLSGKVCMDVGASTGGFTHCILESGAIKVYSVDVGTSQLHRDLLLNPSVISIENTDIRNLDRSILLEGIEFISIDVSFISITKILGEVFEILGSSGEVVALIKPQFEAGLQNVGKNGVVKNPKIHKNILNDVLKFAISVGFSICGLTFSPIKKVGGNIEYLVYMKKSCSSLKFDFSVINSVVESAFIKL